MHCLDDYDTKPHTWILESSDVYKTTLEANSTPISQVSVKHSIREANLLFCIELNPLSQTTKAKGFRDQFGNGTTISHFRYIDGIKLH